MNRPQPLSPGPGQRSVWDFPRPPAIEREPRNLRIIFAGIEIANSSGAVKVLETSHPPVYFFPPEDVRRDCLVRRANTSFCEWKGRALYFDVRVETPHGPRVAELTAFAYPDPSPRFREHADWLSFYAAPMDECWVGDERAEPQPGGFYSGWITRDVVGPFKGVENSWGW